MIEIAVSLTERKHGCFVCGRPRYVELEKIPGDALCFDCSRAEKIAEGLNGTRWFDLGRGDGSCVVLDAADDVVEYQDSMEWLWGL